MATLPLTKHPTSSLRERSKDITEPTSNKIKKLISDMNETMIAADGIGIAAPQVGVNIRLFLVRTDEGYRAYMNPRLSSFGWKKIRFEEGCLSVPGVFGPVKRPTTLTITYTNERGEKIKEKAKGLLARVIQHESDHIQGILFIDKAEKLTPK